VTGILNERYSHEAPGIGLDPTSESGEEFDMGRLIKLRRTLDSAGHFPTFFLTSPFYPLLIRNLFIINKRAGGGNRTLVCSLEGYRSTIELHPQDQIARPTLRCCATGKINAIRNRLLSLPKLFSKAGVIALEELEGLIQIINQQNREHDVVKNQVSACGEQAGGVEKQVP
jgi:hypothetical protein